jgi:hypothetical protein
MLVSALERSGADRLHRNRIEEESPWIDDCAEFLRYIRW